LKNALSYLYIIDIGGRKSMSRERKHLIILSALALVYSVMTFIDPAAFTLVLASLVAPMAVFTIIAALVIGRDGE
jgi:uncharacterized membrane-anchored protein